MQNKSFDVLIVGGGLVGSSIAYHLLHDGFDGSVAILEKDPSYEYATTPRSNGGVRQQFTAEVNMRMSLYSLEAFEKFDEEMAINGEPAHAEFRQRGYLYLGTETIWTSLQREAEYQRSLGAEVDLLTPTELKEMIPHLDIEGLLGGAFGRRGGYTDPYGVLQGYLRKARSLGAAYVHGHVVKINRKGDRILGIETANGEVIRGGIVVIAAGPWASEVGKMAGIDLPIDPIPRIAYCFDPAEKFDYGLPMVIQPDGVYFRHETGRTILAGKAGKYLPPGFRFDWDRSCFEEEIWPSLARLVPCFERLKIIRGWAGIIEVCRHDRNPLLGAFPGVEGLYVAVGFSGHGFQHAPATGKGISDLIRKGRYETIDLSPLAPERLFTGRKVLEEEGPFVPQD